MTSLLPSHTTFLLPTTHRPLAEATLTVDNPRDVAVTVFMRRGPFDTRIGRVVSHDKATLRFPKSAVGFDDSIVIFVQPDGGRDLASQTLKVKRGQHLGIQVPVR